MARCYGAMLHWVKSFSAMAALAGVVALGAYASAVATLAAGAAAVFAVLAALALLTEVLGRGRDGLYSGERAVWTVALAIALVLGVRAWSDAGLSVADVERALGALLVHAAA